MLWYGIARQTHGAVALSISWIRVSCKYSRVAVRIAICIVLVLTSSIDWVLRLLRLGVILAVVYVGQPRIVVVGWCLHRCRVCRSRHRISCARDGRYAWGWRRMLHHVLLSQFDIVYHVDVYDEGRQFTESAMSRSEYLWSRHSLLRSLFVVDFLARHLVGDYKSYTRGR